MTIYIGNLLPGSTLTQVKSAFEPFGNVGDVEIRGLTSNHAFGFVTMPDSSTAQSAISALHGAMLNGRKLTVAEALLPRSKASA